MSKKAIRRISNAMGMPISRDGRTVFIDGEGEIPFKKWAKRQTKMTRRALEDQLTFRSMFPNGWSGQAVDAQVTVVALKQLWELLGVKNQTEAVRKLTELVGARV